MTEKTEAKVKEARERLEAAVDDLRTSEGWQAFLRQQSLFHNYSWGNALLIASQNPNARYVKGFQAWLKLNRCVRKGEKSIAILAPKGRGVATEKDEDGEEKTVRSWQRFGVAHIFDYAQTDPLPGKNAWEPAPSPVVGHVKEGDPTTCMRLYGNLAAWAELEHNVHFAVDPQKGIPETADGYYNRLTNEIWVRWGARPEADMLGTLIHEVAHMLTSSGLQGQKGTTRGTHEVVAEAISFIVCDAIGLDAMASSSEYVASWLMDDPAGFRKGLTFIQKTSHDLIEMLEGAVEAPSSQEEVAA